MDEHSVYGVSSPSSGTANEGKRAHRFNSFQDVMLLRSVVSYNPFNDKRQWDNVATHLSSVMPHISSRCCRERTARLLKIFRSDDWAVLRKSGTEEQYLEKEQLLQEIKELDEDSRTEKVKAEIQKKRQEQEAAPCSEIWGTPLMSIDCPEGVESLAESAENSGSELYARSCYKRKLDDEVSPIMDYLVKKQVGELQLKESELKLRREQLDAEKEKTVLEDRFKMEQLDLEKRRLALAEKKMELEMQRWKAEREERQEDRKMMLQLLDIAVNLRK